MGNEFKHSDLEQIKLYLLSNLNRSKIIPSGREISCACPFCGDSKSDPFATSFYINIDPSSENFLNYHCFRAACNVSGIINEEFFDTVGISDRDCVIAINDFLSTKNNKIGGSFKSKKSKTLINIINEENPIHNKKLNYINKRLGTSLTYSDICNLKINLSLSDLLRYNNIKISDSKKIYYQKLNDYGISFISAYNDYIIIRDVSKSNKLNKRYTNINIFDNYDNVTKTYCIPTTIDLLNPEPCIINISEGVFDILSVFYNTKIDRKYKNQIFIAACGSGLISSIISYIQQYGLINCKINIFSDSDVGVEKYTKLKKIKSYLKKFDVDIYYNNMIGEKDFGVPKNKIKIIKTKL